MAIQDDRIHACLDGELPRGDLNSDELQRLDTMEASLADVAAALKRARVPDLTARVMDALPAENEQTRTPPAAALLRLLAGWLWTPVSIAVRPAYAMAGVAVAVTALSLLPSAERLPSNGAFPIVADADGPGDALLYVQFRIEVPEARQVALAGTFTGWRAELELTEVSPGVWSAMVPLRPGVHDYTFVVDGTQMMVDPYAPSVADSFGGSNSRLFLPAPNESA